MYRYICVCACVCLCVCVLKAVFHFCYIKTVSVKIDKIDLKKLIIKIKGCVCSIYASLYFKCKRQHL